VDPFLQGKGAIALEKARLDPLVAASLGAIVTFDDSEVVVSYVGSEAGQQVAARGPLTPDQIVYCCSFPLWIDVGDADDADSLASALEAAVRAHVDRTGFHPLVVLVKGLGMFTVGTYSPASSAAIGTVK
jgi:rhamnose utilization protein RhaD (predicted bifunctional aldolase and dehydrogenase)